MNKTIELSIKAPRGWAYNAPWHSINERIMQLLVDKFGLIPNYEQQCGWQLDSFLTDDELRRLTLHTFGNTIPAMVKMVSELVIVGDGDCPKCGANDRHEITGAYRPADREGDWGGLAVIGYRCNICGEEDMR